MEFTAMGTIWIKGGKPVVEVEGNFYDVRKEDMRKIVEMRQAQGFSSLKDALHGAEAKFRIVRGAKKALLVDDFLPPAPTKAVNSPPPIIISDPSWIDDSNEAEEGGYYQASAVVKGKKIGVEVWKEKPNFDGGYGTEFREVATENGDYYWARPLGQYAFWPDTDNN